MRTTKYKCGGSTKRPKKQQYGGTPLDLNGLLGSNPLLGGFLSQANDFATKFGSSITPSITNSALGDAPTKMSRSDFAKSEGLNPSDPFSIFKKKLWTFDKDYKNYTKQFDQQSTTYNNNASSLGANIAPMLGSLSTLMQGMKGQQQYDNTNHEADMTESYASQYQEGGDVNQMMEQDPWLKARAQIESGGNQDSTSSAGAKGMFQITPIALKEYNRKYDSKYTWDQIVQNSTANAHVSNGLIKDIRSMIDKVDTNLSDFDKNVLSEMATNYGPYRFLDKLKSKGKNVTLQDMINDHSLPTETRNHGQKFIDYFNKQDKTPQYRPQQIDKTRVEPQVKYTDDQIKKFAGDPYEYKKQGDKYFYRKGLGDFKEINNSGRRELQRRKFQYGGISNLFNDQDQLKNFLSLLPDDNNTTGYPINLRSKKAKIKNDLVNNAQLQALNKVINYSLVASSQQYNPYIYSQNRTVSTPSISYINSTNPNVPVDIPATNSLPNNILPKGDINIEPPTYRVIPDVNSIFNDPNIINRTIGALKLPNSTLAPRVYREPFNKQLSKSKDGYYNLGLDPNKYLVGYEDISLLHSGIQRIYDKSTKEQVGYLNKNGEYLPAPKNSGRLKFEGRPNKLNPSLAKYLMDNVIPKNQYGGNTRYVRASDIGKEKGFLNSWYQRRGSIPQFKNLSNSIYSTMHTSPYNDIEITSNPNKTITGVGGGNTLAEYDPTSKNIDLYGKNYYPGLLTHELNHAVQDINPYLNQHIQKINNFLAPETKNEFGDSNLTDFDQYQRRPEEMHSRMMEFRKIFNLKPEEQFTQDHLNKILNDDKLGINKYKVFESLYRHMPENSRNTSFIDMMNSIVSNNSMKTNHAQMGGNINTTGYTPGTSTMNNPYNNIPSNQITMEKTPFPVKAIPMNNGEQIGKPVIMKPGLNYYFPNANSVLEIPHRQLGGIEAVTNSQKLANFLNDPMSLRKAQLNNTHITPRYSDEYLQQLMMRNNDKTLEQLNLNANAGLGLAPDGATIPVDTKGFIKGKGGDKWIYKNNGNGSFTVIDTTRPDKVFTLDKNSKNKQAYMDVANMFGNNTQSHNTQPNPVIQQAIKQAANISGYPSVVTQPRDNTAVSQYPVDNSGVNINTPVQPTRINRSALPYSSNNPYAPVANKDAIRGTNFNNTADLRHWSNNIPISWQAASVIAPMVTGLGELTGLSKLFGPKLTQAAIEKYAPLFEQQVAKKITKKAIKGAAKRSSNYSDLFSFRYGGRVRRYQMGDEVEQQHNPQEEQQEPQQQTKTPGQMGIMLNGQMGMPEPRFTAIQTEKGEKLYHLDKSISNVAAKKLHKNMNSDEVTDIVPEGTFVGSRDPQMKISKKEADQIVLGNKAIKYEQGKPTALPKDIKFGDIFKSRYHTPAELMDNINRKFKVSKQDKNVFVSLANKENLDSRDQYMDIVKYMTEVKKPVEQSIYKYGGRVKKYQLGDIIGGIGSLIPQIATMFTQSANKNATLNDINKYQTDNNANLSAQTGISGLANLIGYASQDLTPEMYDPTQVLNAVSNPVNAAMNSIQGRQDQNINLARGSANDAYSRLANIDPRLALASASSIGANGLKEANQSNQQLNQYRDSLGIDLGTKRADILRESLLNKQSTLAGARSQRNQLNSGLFGNFAQIGSDYFGGRNAINNTALTAKMGARGQYGNFISNMGYGLGNSLSNIGQGIAGLGKPTTNTYANSNANFSNNLQGITNGISNRPGYSSLQSLSQLPQITPRGGYSNNGSYIGE